MCLPILPEVETNRRNQDAYAVTYGLAEVGLCGCRFCRNLSDHRSPHFVLIVFRAVSLSETTYRLRASADIGVRWWALLAFRQVIAHERSAPARNDW